MNQTSPTHSAELAGALFDEVVIPLAEARRAAGGPPCLPLGRDEGAPTYFSPPSLGKPGPSDFELPRGGRAEGVLAALAALWAAQGDEDLLAMIPRLEALAEVLAHERPGSDGSVDVLCYTLF